jgi:hypothetical protein
LETRRRVIDDEGQTRTGFFEVCEPFHATKVMMEFRSHVSRHFFGYRRGGKGVNLQSGMSKICNFNVSDISSRVLNVPGAEVNGASGTRRES